MAPPVEISIPSTILSTDPSSKPYTLYNLTLRLPLRTFVLQKRYSEFLTLHNSLTSQTSSLPPAPLPGKSWFKSTAKSPELTEERRAGLEKYLRAIAESPDKQWRETSVWRAFLNLPSSGGSGGSVKSELVAQSQRGAGGQGEAAKDPTVWLDLHRELKGCLHDARLALGRRGGASSVSAQHEAGAGAKRALVKAGGLLRDLEEGLKGGEKELGAGEVRRRRDLLGSARVEKDGLEKLAVSLAVKAQSASTASSSTATLASTQDKSSLFGPNVARPAGRVLGGPPIPETDKTRELDNEGVSQLQRQLMKDQDLDVEELGKIVRRQKEMGMAIHGELEYQNELLKTVDENVDRVAKKVDIAKKRVGKIH